MCLCGLLHSVSYMLHPSDKLQVRINDVPAGSQQ